MTVTTARKVAGAAALITVLTVVARIAGFARTFVFLHTVGKHNLADIYNAANTIPNIVFELVAGGALASLVVPLLAGHVATGDRDRVNAVTSALLTWVLVLLVPIALLLIFYRVVLSGDAPVSIDPSATIQEAQQAAVFTVAAPTGLSGDWHASSATFRREAAGATLRIGYVDPGKDPVQLVESSVPPDTLLPGELGSGGKALGNYRTPAGVWRVYDGRPGETALVLAEPARTIVVVGKADLTDLQTLAAALG